MSNCPSSQPDDVIGIRFTCIGIALVSNLLACSHLYYKIYDRRLPFTRSSTILNIPQRSLTNLKILSPRFGPTKQKSKSRVESPRAGSKNSDSRPSTRRNSNQKPIDPRLITGTFVYILLASITVLWNLIYRFMISDSVSQCNITDTIDEYLNVFSRIYLLLLFTYNIEFVFKQSKTYSFNPKFLLILRILIVIEDLLLNTIWIGTMTVCPLDHDNLGVYCYNYSDSGIIYTHLIFFTIFDAIILWLFISRFTKLAKFMDINSHSGCWTVCRTV